MGAAKHLRYHRDLFRSGGFQDLRNKVVLDVGSGFGLGLVAYALFGAREAHGIEYIPEAVEAVDGYIGELPKELARRIHNRQGDAAEMPYLDGTFDALFSEEAISHYLDVPAFISEAARVLKPGGRLIIADGNNAMNPKIVLETRAIWRAFEEGGPGTHVGTHIVGTSYRAQRRELLVSEYPQLTEHDAERLAINTAGFTGARLREVARSYLNDGSVPDNPYRGEVAVSPQGIAMERLIHPKELARILSDTGHFQAKAMGYWGGAGGKWYLRLANTALTFLSPVALRFAPSFRVVARRV
jgi:SAM-dependent methyltransferase